MTREFADLRHPRCVLVYALAPREMPASEANQIFNKFIGDTDLPLVVFHDHFIGHAGGVAIFYVKSGEEMDSLFHQTHLPGWTLDFRPLVFSHSPAAFDEQIAFTLKAYRSVDWERLQREDRPQYGGATDAPEPAEEDERAG